MALWHSNIGEKNAHGKQTPEGTGPSSNGKSIEREHTGMMEMGFKTHYGPLCPWKNMVRRGQ